VPLTAQMLELTRLSSSKILTLEVVSECNKEALAYELMCVTVGDFDSLPKLEAQIQRLQDWVALTLVGFRQCSARTQGRTLIATHARRARCGHSRCRCPWLSPKMHAGRSNRSNSDR